MPLYGKQPALRGIRCQWIAPGTVEGQRPQHEKADVFGSVRRMGRFMNASRPMCWQPKTGIVSREARSEVRSALRRMRRPEPEQGLGSAPGVKASCRHATPSQSAARCAYEVCGGGYVTNVVDERSRIHLFQFHLGAARPSRLCPLPYLVNIGKIVQFRLTLFWWTRRAAPLRMCWMPSNPWSGVSSSSP